MFINHFLIHWFENLKLGYLTNEENAPHIQLPILRLLYSGRASVRVFFVITGFVLCHKPLQLALVGGEEKG